MKSSFTDLVEKYLSGCITANEQLRLFEMMDKEENRAVLNSMINASMQQEMADHPGNEHLKHLSFQLLEEKINKTGNESATVTGSAFVPNRSMRLVKYVAVAASVILFLCAGYYWMFNIPDKKTANTSQVSSIEDYTRHIVLPDSSIVVLHAGSTIRLLDGYNTGKREIVLTGEAYFDVRHDAAMPFIVHTGQVKTTVLGTAFNIQAYPGVKQVVVAVTRGKVRVEDNNKIVATLMSDNQLTYKLKDESASEKSVDASRLVTDWTKKDVVFDSISFREMATILSKRYNVPIKFSNEALKDCHVRTSFKGIESLNEMLDLLCMAMNASYYINDNSEVIISGEGCK